MEAMMPSFGAVSKANLAECDPQLQLLMNEVIRFIDFHVSDGKRTLEEQRKNVAKGVSKTMNSKHLPNGRGQSEAVDAMPYLPGKVPWALIEKGLNACRNADPTLQALRCYAFIGFVLGIASARGIKVGSGVDWDEDWDFGEHGFLDLPHFELLP